MLVFKKEQSGIMTKVRVSEEEVQEVDKFNYLGVMISMGGGIGEEGAHRVVEGRKA